MKPLLLLLCLVLFIKCFSQENNSSSSTPIKIGLVLSGGGAKGFAHVGALKAFEEAGIQINYIGGSSMGAAVGALYASGHTAKQVDSIIVNTDFQKLLTDQLDREYFSFYQKKHDEKYIFTFPIKNWMPGLPIALSRGQNTYNKLNELYHHVHHIHDFSKLPIPFFCMTTNLETGEAVEINSGDLALAIRSSASLPTLLSPSKIGETSFIDGGIADNFPVEKMKEKDVDFIIGIDVQGKLKKSQKLDSALNVIEQIVNYQLYGDINHKLENLDIHIKPEVSEYSLVDFDKKEEIIEAGYQKTKAYISQILNSITSKTPLNKTQKVKIDKQKYKINEISYSGYKNYSKKYLAGKMKLNTQEKISQQELNKKINLLTATNNFNHIYYNFKTTNSMVDIDFEIKENPNNQFLKISGHYDPLYKSAGLFNYTHKHILLKNDKLSFDLALGDNFRYDLNYFIDNGGYTGLGFRTRFNQFNININSPTFNDFLKLNFKYEDYTNYIYAQGIVKNNFTLSVGLEHKHIRSYTNNIPSAKDVKQILFDNSHYLNLLSTLEIDTYDNKNFPTKGFLIDAKWRTFLASDKTDNFKVFSQVNFLIESAWLITKNISFIGQAHTAFTVTPNNYENLNYSVGGYGKNYINNFIPFYGYEFADISTESLVKIAGAFKYNFYKKNYLDIGFNYGYTSNNIIDLFISDSFQENIKSGYTIGLTSDTFIGPIDLRYCFSPENNSDYFSLSVGHWF